jgi:dihydrofolate reductase
MSFDGYVAGPKWVNSPAGPEADSWRLAPCERAGTHVMGRATYLEMAAHWPTSTEPAAAPMNDIPKVVFSKSLPRADWQHTRIARGELVAEATRLKEEPGGDIVAHGGASFVQALVRAGLVDEFRFVVYPWAVGEGLPVFKDLADPLALRLVEATPFPTGALGVVYQPA